MRPFGVAVRFMNTTGLDQFAAKAVRMRALASVASTNAIRLGHLAIAADMDRQSLALTIAD
jgi:hypothetical protein